MEQTKESSFRIKRYGWQELAILYSPDVSAGSASRRLKYWVEESSALHDELTRAGWKPGKRILTPIQVSILVDYLGKP